MGNARFSDDFKRDAVHQITERGYLVSEVVARLGISKHSVYDWKKRFSRLMNVPIDYQGTEIRSLKGTISNFVLGAC